MFTTVQIGKQHFGIVAKDRASSSLVHTVSVGTSLSHSSHVDVGMHVHDNNILSQWVWIK